MTANASLTTKGTRASVTTSFFNATGEEAIIGVKQGGLLGLIQIPDATALGPSKPLIIQDETGLASGTNLITIQPAAGTINGVFQAAISVPFGAIKLYSDGTQWIAENLVVPAQYFADNPAVVNCPAGVPTIIASSNIEIGLAAQKVNVVAKLLLNKDATPALVLIEVLLDGAPLPNQGAAPTFVGNDTQLFMFVFQVAPAFTGTRTLAIRVTSGGGAASVSNEQCSILSTTGIAQ
jgi:hypothetical protein